MTHSSKQPDRDPLEPSKHGLSGSNQPTIKKPEYIKQFGLVKVVLLVIGLLLLLFIIMLKQAPVDKVEAISRDGVVTKIQSLSRLQTVAYSIDTIITSKKQGNWYTLWQDEQKGLFIAHGRVTAGVDLSKINTNNVQLSDSKEGQHIDITLPAAEVFDVYLDDIEVYDIKTGVFGLVKLDPKIFKQAQISGKKQVLATACKGDMMRLATENAQKQIQSLFRLTGAVVTVKSLDNNVCQAL